MGVVDQTTGSDFLLLFPCVYDKSFWGPIIDEFLKKEHILEKVCVKGLPRLDFDWSQDVGRLKDNIHFVAVSVSKIVSFGSRP